MHATLIKQVAGACGLAALLAITGCGDRSSETAAQREARQETAQEAQSPLPREEAAARAAAQRSGATELGQGRGS
jgi:hypothetical protein